MAGNLAKKITGMRIDTAAQKAVAQYGYNPKTTNHRAMGPGSHYVYPDIFDAGSDDGLRRGPGVAVAAGGLVTSQFLDISGWARYTVYFNFAAVIPVGGFAMAINAYADPAFNNFIGQIPPVDVFGAGNKFAIFDSQQHLASGLGFPATPYIQVIFSNGGAVGITFNAVMFVYSYLAR